MNTRKQQQGFTIIEVVLVLAIAALIFLMVFIALPALQRNQRDTARKNDASAVAAALNNYRSQNRGSFASIDSTALQNYIDKLDQYDTTDVSVGGTGNVTPGEDGVAVRTGEKCPATAPAPNAKSLAPETGTSRSAMVVVQLENNGSQTLLHCVDV